MFKQSFLKKLESTFFRWEGISAMFQVETCFGGRDFGGRLN